MPLGPPPAPPRGPEPGGLVALLARRRSSRAFASRPLGLAQLAVLAWAAQGRTGDAAATESRTEGGTRRTCPSAHQTYPLTLTVLAGGDGVEGLAAGAYDYTPEQHALCPKRGGDHRERVAATTLADYDWLRHAPVLLLLSGDMEGATRHFAEQPPKGRRGSRYVWLEAGHASQNVYLQAAELGLGAVLVAGFDDYRLTALTPRVVPAARHPLALLALGHPATPGL
ncbi:hypothetical protein AN216_11730 [Streptomyces oceani]|uniref:Nitroreductase domain-containing protein n=1 Tax=Streptomyces oceani TaxID=1075402 RepID=A0A1E7KHY3_9ACTN|nr:hypothetical protein AN216_11730 [Streptomyces oceani]